MHKLLVNRLFKLAQKSVVRGTDCPPPPPPTDHRDVKQQNKQNICLNLTILGPDEFSIKFDTVKSGWFIVYYVEGSQVIIKEICGGIVLDS